VASKGSNSRITSSVTSPVTSGIRAAQARQFRERLTRVTSPVVPGKATQAKQANRYTP